jgi:quercetin dioxygenase-like cupin family protein
MPASPTLFNWSKMPFDKPTNLIDRRRIVGEKTMISHVTLYKGFEVATHFHENEQISCILSGCLRFGLGNKEEPGYREVDLRAGEAELLPSNAPHSATALEDTVVLDVFSPPSETTGVDAHSS